MICILNKDLCFLLIHSFFVEKCYLGLYRIVNFTKGPSWPWSYVSWIYTYLCN